MNIAPLDWTVLAVYLVVITAIGLIVGYRVRQSGEYFLGGRRFGPWLMIGQSFGVGTHAEMPVALAGAVYSIGASAIWFQWKNLFATPFYWIMAPVFRRDPTHDDGRVDRGSLRILDGRPLHRVRACASSSSTPAAC